MKEIIVRSTAQWCARKNTICSEAWTIAVIGCPELGEEPGFHAYTACFAEYNNRCCFYDTPLLKESEWSKINRKLDSGETVCFKIVDDGYQDGGKFIYKIEPME